MIRKIVPRQIAAEIVGVQPMSDPFTMKLYSILETRVVDGKNVYSIETSSFQVVVWIDTTLTEGVDYEQVSNLKGIWFDLTEEAMILLKLKWA